LFAMTFLSLVKMDAFMSLSPFLDLTSAYHGRGHRLITDSAGKAEKRKLKKLRTGKRAYSNASCQVPVKGLGLGSKFNHVLDKVKDHHNSLAMPGSSSRHLNLCSFKAYLDWVPSLTDSPWK